NYPYTCLKPADFQRLIASGRAVLQLPEDVAAAPFRIGHQPGEDLFPLSLKGVLVGTPPAQDAFSPLLLSVQGIEPYCWIGDTPLGKNVSCSTSFHRKDVERCRRDAWNERRAIYSTAKDGLL